LDELKPDALIVTHAHSDHLGAVPVLLKLLPDLPVFMTQATARLALPMLSDAARVAQRNGAELYTEDDVIRLLQHVTTIEAHVPFEIGEVQLTPRPSGHIVGAVGLLLEHRPSGFRVWHTADFNTVATPTTDAAWIPEEPEAVDAVVTETTYGTLELPARKSQNSDFVEQVKRVLAGGGRVLVPTFALGRAQDVLLTLTRQVPGVRIYLDGLTREVTRLFAAMPEQLPSGVRNQLDNGTDPFFPSNVTLVENWQAREAIIRERQPSVILASSGMLSQGVSPQYARHVLKEPESAVLMVGYQDAESAGRRLLEGRQEVLLNGELVPVVSHVERFYLSAHADRLGISQHLSRYPAPRLLLTHGEGAAREAIFELFRKERHVDRPKVGEWVALAGETPHTRTPTPQGQSLPKPKRGPLRIKRYKTEVVMRREGNQLIIDLPEGLDPDLTPEGSYRLELEKASLAKLKLISRPMRSSEDRVEELTVKEVAKEEL
jgi:Cft2 family RNA processing exonuclease